MKLEAEENDKEPNVAIITETEVLFFKEPEDLDKLVAKLRALGVEGDVSIVFCG